MTLRKRKEHRLEQNKNVDVTVFINDEKVPAVNFAITADQLKDGVKLRKGKKIFHKAVLA